MAAHHDKFQLFIYINRRNGKLRRKQILTTKQTKLKLTQGWQ